MVSILTDIIRRRCYNSCRAVALGLCNNIYFIHLYSKLLKIHVNRSLKRVEWITIHALAAKKSRRIAMILMNTTCYNSSPQSNWDQWPTIYLNISVISITKWTILYVHFSYANNEPGFNTILLNIFHGKRAINLSHVYTHLLILGTQYFAILESNILMTLYDFTHNLGQLWGASSRSFSCF